MIFARNLREIWVLGPHIFAKKFGEPRCETLTYPNPPPSQGEMGSEFRSGLAFGGVRVRCLCVRCVLPAPGVSAVACPSSRVSCPGVEILQSASPARLRGNECSVTAVKYSSVAVDVPLRRRRFLLSDYNNCKP